MSIRSTFEYEKLRAIGRIVATALEAMAASVRPGITTAELDAIGARVLDDQGAVSAPPKVYGFPGAVCISVNDEAIHGIPGTRVVQPGDLVKLDLVAEKDGFYADAAVSIAVPPVNDLARQLARCAEAAFRRSLRMAQAGNRIYQVGRVIEREAHLSGFRAIRELCGHGVGRTIHEEPQVPNFADPRARQKLTEGLVITIEPILSAGSGRAYLAKDGWTIRTSDGALSSHYEHTVVITKGDPVILTTAA
jgi:methionyl aminopeptidase